jgi:uncharacterized protein (DUF2249 family)
MNLELATSHRDAEAAAAVREHHARMSGSLAMHVDTLLRAAVGPRHIADDVRRELVGWCRRELVPHALAEEGAMYPAARATLTGRLLVEGMLAEHTVITGLVAEVERADDPVRAAASAYALKVAFDSHLAKENDLVLPLLVETPGVSVADLLGGMHELLGEHAHGEGEHAAAGHGPAAATEATGATEGGHSCGCHEVDGPGFPELDARAVPHAIRHATIFGALDSVPSGSGLVLVAPHDPLPLLAQVEDRYDGAFEFDYLERGPEAWRVVFTRPAAA